MKTLTLFDSVKKQKLPFIPIQENKVKLYVCGPTVYDDSHLGHARSAIAFDLLHRTLLALGYEVEYARNFTDIDDKIVNGAKIEQIDELEFSNIYNTDREFASDSYYIGDNKLMFEKSNGQFISLIYSDDNGETWQNGTITDTSGYIIYMNFFNKNDGITMICYGNEIGQREHIRASLTRDGGKTWTTQKSESSSVRINRGAVIEFTSMNEGTIENISYDGSKTVYVTKDGGATWEQ